jgi:hypothetical protein
MFYLEQSFRLIKAKITSFLLFIVFGFLVIGHFIWGQQVESYLGLGAQQVESNSYFHALVTDKENHSRLSRRLIELPGVKNVELLSKEELTAQVESLLKNIGMADMSDFGGMDYIGLKIVFNADVSERSESLIRDYLVRLVGEDKVTLGVIHRPDIQSVNDSSPYASWKKMGITLVLGTFWMFSFINIFKESLRVGYLVDKFQRKKSSGTKIFTTTMIISNVLLALVVVAFQLQMNWKVNLNYIHVGAVAGMLFVTLAFCYQRNRSWQNH